MGQYARESYDAVWAAALALQRSLLPRTAYPVLNLEEFDYSRDDIAARLFVEMAHLRFNGVSGPILFQGADRVGTSAFFQFQGNNIII